MGKIEVRRMVTAAAAACEEKKAERIHILELDPADSGFTDYFLICSGTNERQNQAIATGIEQTMKRDFGALANSVEGYRQGEWILLDYVDFVVHIFSEEKRDFYDIERLRKTATSLGLEELKASLTKKVAAVRKKHVAGAAAAGKKTVKKAAAKEAPAKKKSVARSSKATADRSTEGKPTRGKAAKPVARRTAAKKTAVKRPARKPKA